MMGFSIFYPKSTINYSIKKPAAIHGFTPISSTVIVQIEATTIHGKKVTQWLWELELFGTRKLRQFEIWTSKNYLIRRYKQLK